MFAELDDISEEESDNEKFICFEIVKSQYSNSIAIATC